MFICYQFLKIPFELLPQHCLGLCFFWTGIYKTACVIIFLNCSITQDLLRFSGYSPVFLSTCRPKYRKHLQTYISAHVSHTGEQRCISPSLSNSPSGQNTWGYLYFLLLSFSKFPARTKPIYSWLWQLLLTILWYVFWSLPSEEGWSLEEHKHHH